MQKQVSTIKKKKRTKSKRQYAICDAKIATTFNGMRLVRKYKSGEVLVGKIEN